MKNATKPVIIQRITHFPNGADMATAMLLGVPAMAQSVWVAVGVNTQEVVAQDPDKAKVLQILAEKGNYKVTRILNDWN